MKAHEARAQAQKVNTGLTNSDLAAAYAAIEKAANAGRYECSIYYINTDAFEQLIKDGFTVDRDWDYRDSYTVIKWK